MALLYSYQLCERESVSYYEVGDITINPYNSVASWTGKKFSSVKKKQYIDSSIMQDGSEFEFSWKIQPKLDQPILIV